METQQNELKSQNENSSDFDLIEIKAESLKTEDGNEIFPWIMYINDSDPLKTVYSLYLYDIIVEPSFYVRLFEIMRKSKTEDLFKVYINCPGGSIATLIAFVNVIEECKANVDMYIDGFAESAAAILAFVGDHVIFGDNTGIMFHDIHTSVVNMQNTGIVKAGIDSMHKIYGNLLKKYCSNILSTKDIKDIMEKGTEIYFTGTELQKKFN